MESVLSFRLYVALRLRLGPADRLTSGTPSPAPLVILKIICSGIWLAPSNRDLRYALYSEESQKEKGGYSDEGYGLEDTESGVEGTAEHRRAARTPVSPVYAVSRSPLIFCVLTSYSVFLFDSLNPHLIF